MDTFTLQWKLSLEQITGTPFAELDAEMLAVVRDSYFASSIDGEILAYSGLYVFF